MNVAVVEAKFPAGFIRITMSCTLVFDNGKSSGWERKGSTVASGNPVFFKHKYVPSKFIYVKKVNVSTFLPIRRPY